MTAPAPAPRGRLAELLSLAWPIVLMRASFTLIGFFDILLVAPLGDHALTVTATGALNLVAIVLLPLGAIWVVQSFVAQHKGAGDVVAARRYAWYGLILAALVGLAVVCAMPLVGPALGLFAYGDEVHRLMTEYLQIRLLSLGAFLATEAIAAWYGGMGNTRPPLVASVVTVGVKLPLSWLLVQGHLGAPAMGVAGAATASAIAAWAAFLVLLVPFSKWWFVGGKPPREPLRLRWQEFRRVLRFGLPNGVNIFLDFGAYAVFINAMIVYLGDIPYTAQMMVLSLNAVFILPVGGIAAAGAILVARAIGASDAKSVPQIIKLTVWLNAGYQGVVGLVYLLAPTLLLSLVLPPGGSRAQLIEVGTVILALCAAWQLFNSIEIAFNDLLRATGDTLWCMWIRGGLPWLIFVPGSAIWIIRLHGGYIAANVCLLVYGILVVAAMAWRVRSGAWRRFDLLGTRTDA